MSELNREDPLDKEIACPVCQTAGPFKVVDKIEDFILLKCNHCFLEFTKSMRYDAGYYEDMHYADNPNLEAFIALNRDEFLKRAAKLATSVNWQPHQVVLRWIDENFKKESTILDIGCGIGWFPAALEAKGFKVVGIEVSSRIVELLKSKGFQVYVGPLENIDIALPEPDLVVLLGVIEHVEDPVRLLNDIHRRFPAAKVLVSIPNPKRWDFGLGIRNYWDYPPNHLTPVWSQLSLDIALKKAGFSLKEWFYPPVTSDEIWFIIVDKLFYKLGLRRKGYFVGLTSEVTKSSSTIKSVIKALYRVFEKINALVKFSLRPFLNVKAKQLMRRGYSGLSAFVLAEPV